MSFIANDEPGPLSRVLIAAHSHPRVQNGGSEVAPYALFERLRQRSDIRSWYCGCIRTSAFARTGQSITQPFERDEYLYTLGEFDGFRFANRDTAFARDFRVLLQNLRPDIVHFHHYLNFGMEAFAHVREMLPDARIILTLHEFLAICHQQGQMVTRQLGRPCGRSGYVECSRCFPELQPADFFIRDIYIRNFLKHVDHYVAPSHFLAQRYIDWGIPRERISIIENVSRATVPSTPRHGDRPSGALRVGFFGQISMLKGIQVMIEAAALLQAEERSDIVFVIHGDHSHQPEPFRTGFLSQVDAFGANIVFEGAYANNDVDTLMAAVDVVLVPSVWWENSPVVIQEAFRNGRPVICSDIGGMAEKVTHGETGLHFKTGSARALAGVLKALVADPERLATLEDHVARLHPQDDPLAAHLQLYRTVRIGTPDRLDLPAGVGALGPS